MSLDCKINPPIITIETNVDFEPTGNAIVGTIVSAINIQNIIECTDADIFINDTLPLNSLFYIRPKN